MKALRTWTLFVLFLNAAQVFAKVEATIGPVPLDQNANLAIQLPTTKESEILISRDQYLISYNKNRRTPNWVAWRLEDRDIGGVKRTNAFNKDPDLENYLARAGEKSVAVDPADYSGSCFDRGHQVPSADRTDNVHNNEETFVMTNMIPQTAYLNRVVWEHFEGYTRDLVKRQGKKIYVIAGPVYDEDFGAIGPNKDIAVPSKDFKILIVLDANQNATDAARNAQIIAVMMPNIDEDGSKPLQKKTCSGISAGHGDQNDWKQYQTSVQAIEKASGLHFSM